MFGDGSGGVKCRELVGRLGELRLTQVMLVMVIIVGSLRIRKHLETGRSFSCNGVGSFGVDFVCEEHYSVCLDMCLMCVHPTTSSTG